jgi:autotransporter translocation and assembly factor TamB
LLRFVARLSLVTVVVVGACVGAVLAWSQTAPGQAWIAQRIQTLVRKKVPGFAVERLSLGLPARFHLFGVTVRDSSGIEAIRIAQLHARIDLRALFSRTIRVEDLALFGPRVVARQPADQQLNLATLLRPANVALGQAGAPWRFEIRNFVLSDGVLDWQSIEGHRSARDVTATGSVLVGDGQARATLRLWAEGQVGGRLLTVALDATGVISSDRIDLRINHLGGDGLLARWPLVLEGTARGPYDALALDLHARLPPAGEAHITGRLGLAGGLSYDLLIDAARISPDMLLATWPTASLAFTAKLNGSGTPLTRHAVAALDVALQESEVEGIGPLHGHLSADSVGPAWRLQELVANGLGLALRATGGGQEQRLALDLDGEIAHTSAWMGLPGGLRGSARVHGQVRFDLSTAVASVRARARVRNLAYRDFRVGEAQLVLVAAGSFWSPTGQLRMKARDVQGIPRIGRVDQLDLFADNRHRHLLVSGSASSALGQAHLEASGVITRERADITLQRFSAGHGFSTVTLLQPASVQWRRRHSLTVQSLRLAALGGRIEVAGRLEQRTREMEAHVVARQVHVLAGGPAADLDLHVGLARSRMQMTALLGMQSFPPASATADLPVSWPPRAPLPALAKDGPVTIHLDVAGISATALPQGLRTKTGLRAGRLAATVDVSGSLIHPQAQVRATLTDGVFGPVSRVGADLTAALSEGTVEAQVRASLDGQIVAQAVLATRGDVARVLATRQVPAAPLEGEVDLPGFDLSRVPGLSATGRVSGHVHLGGSLLRPTLRLDLTAVEAKLAGVGFVNLAAHGEYGAGLWQAHARANQAAGGRLDVSAIGEGYELRSAGLRAEGVNIAFLEALLPDFVAARGQLDASLELARGTLTGTLSLAQGRLGLLGWPTFEQINLRAQLASDQIQIEQLDAKVGKGGLSLTGQIGMSGGRLTSLQMNARAKGVPISTAALSDATLDVEANASGQVKDKRLDASLRIGNARLEIPRLEGGRSLHSLAPMQGVVFVGEPAAAPPPATVLLLPQSVHLVVQADDFRVQGQDLQAACKVDVSLDSSSQQTRMAGRIATEWGNVFLFGNRYTVDRASLNWSGGENLDPVLDIQLSGHLPEAMVIISVRGRMSKPDLSLASDPPTYSKAELVSLVLTGHIPTASEASHGDVTGSALSAISTAIIGNLAERIAPALGAGVVRVQSVPASATSAQAAQAAAVPQASAGALATRVEIGKNLTDRVYVGYSRIFGAGENENSNEGRFEYRMSRRWVLQSEYGDAGVGGFDLLWTTRY